MEKIEMAINEKWKVEIAYVFRDLELALYGAIQRKREVGRGVPLNELPKVHRNVQKTVLELSDIYRTSDSVSFLYLHNLGLKGIEALTPAIELIDLEMNGALHNLERHEQYYQQIAEALEKGHG